MSAASDFRSMVATLVAKGHHAPTAFWMPLTLSFIASGKRRWVARVGRGGTKSFMLVVLALFYTLFVPHPVPPGEVHYWAFVSVSKDEAAQRLRLMESFLDALGVPYTRSGDVIDLTGRRLGFRVFTCSIGGVSGFRCIGFCGDEMAKWRSGDGSSSANPAHEVVASLRAMTVTHREAREFMFSSPMGTSDFHAECFEAGDDEDQLTTHAPTWLANPSLTEEQTKKLERDPRVHSREYGAEAHGGACGAFEPAHVEKMFGRSLSEVDGYQHWPVITLDASSMRGDGFVTAVCQWVVPDFDRTRSAYPEALKGPVDEHGKRNWDYERDQRTGRPILDPVHGWRFRPCLMVTNVMTHDPSLAADEVADEIAWIAGRVGASTIIGDQHGAFGWEATFRQRRLTFHEVTWTASRKADAAYEIRRLMRDGQIVVPFDGSDERELAQLRREALAYEERLSPATGVATYSAPRGMHDDRVAAALMTPAMADAAGFLPGSPFARGRGRNNAPWDERQ